VSKLNDVETVETVEGAEATRNGYEEREAVTHGSAYRASDPWGAAIFPAICGHNLDS
jgi:hypothetical protein